MPKRDCDGTPEACAPDRYCREGKSVNLATVESVSGALRSNHAQPNISCRYQSLARANPEAHLRLVMIFKFRKLILLTVTTAALFAAASNVLGQSTDASLPTAVLSNEINGKINALDLGDARVTRHFYAFEGNPGDLLITIDSKNLNGDVDVFTATTFRPLMKTTLYAYTQTPEITKGIYLRTRQILILRVEARTPSDEPGTYHIRFGGTFEKFSGGIPVAEPSNAEAETASEKSGANRLSSAGATIPRPVTETVETPEAKPSPEKPAEKPEESEAKKSTTTTSSRRSTSRNPRRNTRPAPVKTTPPRKTESAKTETEKPKPETRKTSEEKPVEAEKPVETKAEVEKPKTQEVPVGARLLIEQKDGTRIDRPMSTVRRVIVEGNMIVIVLKTGKTERIPMSDVARMAIEPQ